jgi:hypothetical protein
VLLSGDETEEGGKPKLGKDETQAKGSTTGHGFIAQELIEVAPLAVHAPDDGKRVLGEFGEDHTPWLADFAKLVPYLVAEVQALRKRVAQLEGH